MTKAKTEIPIEDLPIEDVEALLRDSLRPDDLGEAKAIKHEISAVINWGDLTQSVSKEIFNMIEGLCDGELPELTKLKPIKALCGDALRIMGNKAEDNRVIQYMVYFLLAKKLLGALKTDINKKIGSIRILSPSETETVEQIVADEELLMEAEELGQTEDDIEIVARLESGSCKHPRTIVRSNKQSRCLESFCKDCRTVITTYQNLGLTVIDPKDDDGRPAKRKSKKCKHRWLIWVEGEEGKVAECADQEGCTHRVTDVKILEGWNWASAGLEPFGDDPTQDEVIELCP